MVSEAITLVRSILRPIYFLPALIFRHLARCAAAILRLPAADIVLRGAFVRFVCFTPVSNRSTCVSFSISFLISSVMDSMLIGPLG